MAIHLLESRIHIPASLDKVWGFFSDPDNLKVLTPGWLNLKIIYPKEPEPMFEGQIITYRVRPLLNIPLQWVTEISKVKELEYFIDRQLKGPYRLWHHLHTFKQVNGGVEMVDKVHYDLPLDLITDLFHDSIVKPKLTEIFQFRKRVIKEMFGENNSQTGYIRFS